MLTASLIGKRVPTPVDSLAAAPGVIVAGLPARLRRSKLATGAWPLVAAEAVNRPAVVFAVSAGELAMPAAFVVAVAWVEPVAKLAPAAPAPPEPPVAPLLLPSVKVTVAPCSGLPLPSRTFTA